MPSTELSASPLGPRTAGDARPVHQLKRNSLVGISWLTPSSPTGGFSNRSLRAIVRGMLATNPPSVAHAFTAASRQRLLRVDATAIPDTTGIFVAGAGDTTAAPTEKLHDILVRIRTLYGSGLGFASLRILSRVVSATIGVRWEEDSDTEDVLANIDADISQAIQSSKEELDSGRVTDLQDAREIVQELRSAVNESQMDVKKWDGAFPFERAASSLEYWRV